MLLALFHSDLGVSICTRFFAFALVFAQQYAVL